MTIRACSPARLGELGDVDVDLLHHPVVMLELIDGVLELTVEHHPVGDDHHLVEHVGVPACRLDSR